MCSTSIIAAAAAAATAGGIRRGDDDKFELYQKEIMLSIRQRVHWFLVDRCEDGEVVDRPACGRLIE